MTQGDYALIFSALALVLAAFAVGFSLGRATRPDAPAPRVRNRAVVKPPTEK